MTRTLDYTYTGAQQYVDLPAGTSILDLWGANGGNGLSQDGSTDAGGVGDYVRIKITCTSLTRLYLYVGGRGSNGVVLNQSNTPAGYGPGWNGGGGPPAATNQTGLWPGTGGGATDVRLDGTALTNRKGVASGGGGGGGFWAYGTSNGTRPAGQSYAGGSGNGQTGNDGSGPDAPSYVGGGGSQTQGGVNRRDSAKPGGAGPYPVTYAALGVGGDGLAGLSSSAYDVRYSLPSGGGGGGGYYGGGGGGGANNGNQQPSGGGAGSSNVQTSDSRIALVTMGRPSNGSMPNPDSSGNGFVRVITNYPPGPPSVTSPAQNGKVIAGQNVVVSVTTNDPEPNESTTRVDVQVKANGASGWASLNNVGFTVPDSSDVTRLQVNWGTSYVNGTTLEYQVRTYDASAAQGQWSQSYFATASAPPSAPTITAPTSGQVIASTPIAPQVTVPAGYDAALWQTRRISPNGATTYFDSGATSALTPIPMDAVSGRTDRLQIRYMAAGVWSPYASVDIDVELGPPPRALVTSVTDPSNRGVLWSWTTPAPSSGQSPAVSVDLFVTDPFRTNVRIGHTLPATGSFFDPEAPASTKYRQNSITAVVQTQAANGATTRSDGT